MKFHLSKQDWGDRIEQGMNKIGSFYNQNNNVKMVIAVVVFGAFVWLNVSFMVNKPGFPYLF